MAHDLARGLLDLIQHCIPTLQAAEVLLFFAASPNRVFSADQVGAAIRTGMAATAVQEHVTQFVAAGLLAESADGFAYRPASPALERTVSDLRRAYDERPVTLITTIYRIADRRIQSFSDSFKLRDD
jgi:hypothetical protein